MKNVNDISMSPALKKLTYLNQGNFIKRIKTKLALRKITKREKDIA